MLVAITDYSFPDLSLEEAVLRPLDCEMVALKEKRPPSDLANLVADADAVITQFAPVNAEVIAAMRRAKVIVRYGIGVDNVDLRAAADRGIPVCNVPDYCIDEVADQSLAFILASTRRIVANSQKVALGGWGLAVPLDSMRSLRGMEVGIVGYGRIGREVARRLLAFGCRIMVVDPLASADELRQAGMECVSLSELFSRSDLITLHCPSNDQTRRLIHRESIAQMKRGVTLVNVSRGDLVDPAALVEALRQGQIGFAALDVFDPEPIPPGHAILGMENVVFASHIASCSPPAVQKLRQTAASIAAMALRGEKLINVVNGVK